MLVNTWNIWRTIKIPSCIMCYGSLNVNVGVNLFAVVNVFRKLLNSGISPFLVQFSGSFFYIEWMQKCKISGYFWDQDFHHWFGYGIHVFILYTSIAMTFQCRSFYCFVFVYLPLYLQIQNMTVLMQKRNEFLLLFFLFHLVFKRMYSWSYCWFSWFSNVSTTI